MRMWIDESLADTTITIGGSDGRCVMCRRQEKEADIIGMDLAARACFKPCAAVAVFRKLGAAEKQFMDKAGVGRMPAYLRTHPPSEARTPARAAPAAACACRMVAERGGLRTGARAVPAGTFAGGPAPRCAGGLRARTAWRCGRYGRRNSTHIRPW